MNKIKLPLNYKSIHLLSNSITLCAFVLHVYRKREMIVQLLIHLLINIFVNYLITKIFFFHHKLSFNHIKGANKMFYCCVITLK